MNFQSDSGTWHELISKIAKFRFMHDLETALLVSGDISSNSYGRQEKHVTDNDKLYLFRIGNRQERIAASNDVR